MEVWHLPTLLSPFPGTCLWVKFIQNCGQDNTLQLKQEESNPPEQPSRRASEFSGSQALNPSWMPLITAVSGRCDDLVSARQGEVGVGLCGQHHPSAHRAFKLEGSSSLKGAAPLEGCLLALLEFFSQSALACLLAHLR